MKKKLLLGLLLIFTIKTFSQNSKFSIEVSYPYKLNTKEKDHYTNEEIQKNILDLGVKYSILEKSIFEFGFGINGSYLKKEVNNLKIYPDNTDRHYKYFLIQPKIYGKTKFTDNSKLALFFAVGYSFESEKMEYLHYYSNVPAGHSNYISGNSKESNSGFNLNTGLTLDFSKKIFIQVQYDLTIYNKKEYYIKENLNLLKFGLGYRI